MTERSSTALVESQAALHCGYKGLLYDIDMTIGKRIKLARKRIPGLTQPIIAKACGVTTQAVSQWERGKDQPKREHYPILRKILRLTFAYLHAGTGDPPPVDDPVVRAEDLQMELYEKQAIIEANKSPPIKRPRKRH